jgi:transposase
VPLLFVGDDWAQDHHDIEILDEAGRRLAKRRLPEGLAGLSTLHALIAARLPEPGPGADPVQVLASVKVGIETGRGPWVAALVAAGYEVYAINPKKSSRYRELHSTSGAKSDPGDAHVLAQIVRLDRAHHRPVTGDSAQAEANRLVGILHGCLKTGTTYDEYTGLEPPHARRRLTSIP